MYHFFNKVDVGIFLSKEKKKYWEGMAEICELNWFVNFFDCFSTPLSFFLLIDAATLIAETRPID